MRVRTGAEDGARDLAPIPIDARGEPSRPTVRGGVVQARLTVGAADAPLEREADLVADRVMRMGAPPSAESGPASPGRAASGGDGGTRGRTVAASITPLVQRSQSDPAEGVEPGPDFERRLDPGGGSPLSASARAFMEPRFGVRFDGVRIHAGGEAARLNREVNAEAFTQGSDIYLGGGKDDLDSAAGQRLLAHELTHVVQQSKAGASALAGPGSGAGLGATADRAAGAGLLLRKEADTPEAALPLLPRFAGRAKLRACFQDKDRLRPGDPDTDAVRRLQQALLDVTEKTGVAYDLGPTGADGDYGSLTTKAVIKFKEDQALGSTQFGDVGPGTMHRLNLLLQPAPTPAEPSAKLDVTCARAAQPGGGSGDVVRIVGTGFTADTGITIALDSIPSGFTGTDAKGGFVSPVDTGKLPTGDHSISVISGAGEIASAPLTLPCPEPKPVPGPASQTLEDLLEAIWAEHAFRFQLMQNALVRLEADLQPGLQEAPSDAAKQFLGRAVVDSAAALFGGPLAASVADALGLAGKASDVMNWAITPILTGVLDATKGTTEDEVKRRLSDDPGAQAEQLGVFIDGAKRELLLQERDKHQEFLKVSKPKAQQVPAHPVADATCQDPDPRVCDAGAALDGLHKTDDDAFNKQYAFAAEGWTVFIAKAVLNKKGDDKGGTNLGADANDEPADARGVLTLRVGGTSAFEKVHVLRATISGLSKTTRKRLNEFLKDTPIGQLHMPRVAEGGVELQNFSPGGGLAPGSIEIAKNEEGKVFNRGQNRVGLDWLRLKGARANGAFDPVAGATAVWSNEIDPVKVREIESKASIEEP